MINGIHHTAISTGDFERALTFYRDLLGFEVISEFGWPAGLELADRITGLEGSAARVAMLRLGSDSVELFEFTSPAPKTGDAKRPVCDHGITHIALAVADIDAEYRRLKEAGMVFHCPPQDMGASRVTYGRDPDGNVIELLETAEP
jgi:catechol 2,3-dioxygenase-like lactoylglutathione lyase family enzyme